MPDDRRAVQREDIERALADGPKTIGEIMRSMSAEHGGVSLALIGMRAAGLVTAEPKEDPDKPRRWRLVEQEPEMPASRRPR